MSESWPCVLYKLTCAVLVICACAVYLRILWDDEGI